MRRALRILFAFVVLVVVAVVAAVFLLPRERIVALAADRVRAATGRELVLAGDISPSFWPVLGVRTGAVRLSNADWGEAPDMISASAAEIGVELMPLLSGEVKVTKLRLVDPVVALEIDSTGHPNWDFGGSGHGQGGGATLPKIVLPQAVITNGSLSFHDARSGQRIALENLDLTAGLAGIDAPLRLDGSGEWNGQRASLDAVIKTPSDAIAGRPVTVQLSLSSDPARLSFNGGLQMPSAANIPRVDGKISIRLTRPDAALVWATGTAAPDGLSDIEAVKLEGTVTADDAALKLTARGSADYKSRTVTFDLTADGAAGWLDRQAFAVEVNARTEGLFELSFGGPVMAGPAPSANGRLKAAVTDLPRLAEWTSGAALDTPAGSFETARIDTQLALTGGDRLDFSELTMKVDDTTLTGDAGIELGGVRPLLTARLASGPLDLSPFMASGDASGAGTSRGWSTAPLDFSALRTVDADVAIRAEAVDLGEIDIGRSDIAAKLRDGRLDMDIRRVDAYGGGMTGTVVLQAGEETRIATDLTITQVQLRPLLNALAGVDNLEGLGAFGIQVDGHGRSMESLIRSLDGRGRLDLTDGAILGLNLAAMVRNLTGRGGGVQKTDFSAVTGTFDITRGVLHNTDFSFLGPLLRVAGAGTVDLGGRTQNFRLEPTAVASLTGQGGTLAESGLGVFPILITGTWSNPKIRPDLTSTIQGLLTDPNQTAETVSGMVRDADPGKAAGALIGAVTGDSGPDSPAGAIGQVLGGILGGASTSSRHAPAGEAAAGETGDQTGTVAQPSYDGGLLGALGGGRSGAGTPGQPSANDRGAGPPTPEFDASEFAPERAPLPRPAGPARAAGFGTLDNRQPNERPAANTESLDETSIIIPAPVSEPQPVTTRAPEIDHHAEEPAPNPVPEPDATMSTPELTSTTDTPTRHRQTKNGGETAPKGRRERDGGLTPEQILRSIQK